MTAVPVAVPATPRPLTQRLWNIARLHAANPFTILATPLIVLGIIFTVNWVIWLIVKLNVTRPDAVSDVSQGFQYSGASLWIFAYMMVVAVQAMNLTFPLALGFGATRRDFYLGSALTFVGLSAFYALLYTALTFIESATDGWGVGGSMFRAVYFGPSEEYGARLFVVFVMMLFFFFVGAAVAAMYVRWRQRGLIGFFAALALILLGGVTLLTATGGWTAFGRFFADAGFLGGYALTLIPTAVAALAGYLILRRATPRT